MIFTDEQIAEAIHTVNGLIQRWYGEPQQPPWEQVPADMRVRVLALVRLYRNGGTARAAHEQWCERMAATGWRQGPRKDAALRTHPNLVPYRELPQRQRVKDLVSLNLTWCLVTESREEPPDAQTPP